MEAPARDDRHREDNILRSRMSPTNAMKQAILFPKRQDESQFGALPEKR
jgi:hypothetical protein